MSYCENVKADVTLSYWITHGKVPIALSILCDIVKRKYKFGPLKLEVLDAGAEPENNFFWVGEWIYENTPTFFRGQFTKIPLKLKIK